MIPRKSEWNTWSTIDKVTYLAQILVPFSLLITVIFSFLAWRESRKSYELQSKIFQAQDSPEVSVESIKIIQEDTAPLLLIPIQNRGNSIALDICVSLYRIGDNTPFVRSCDEGRPFVGLSLYRSEGFNIPISSIDNLEEIVGFRPHDVHVLMLGEKQLSCPSTSFEGLVLSVQYRDALNGKYSRLYTLLLCRK